MSVYAWLEAAADFLSDHRVLAGVKALVIVLLGIFVSRVLRRRLRLDMLRPQHTLIVSRALSLLVLVLAIAWALSELGLNLGVVLGAAGVLTVAVGFAAQTSVSNLISGVFLMAEQPFAIGDVIRVNDISGEVLAIDSLSIKLRTFDNLLVRIPNETMLKANVTNLTHFAIRRHDMKLRLPYSIDLKRVRELLCECAYRNPQCLADPKPSVMYTSFGESGIEVQFSIWSTTANYVSMFNSMYEDVKQVLDSHGILIPYPQRTIHIQSSDTANAGAAQAAPAAAQAAKPDLPPPQP